MKQLGRSALICWIVAAAVAPAQAGPPVRDPDWPCPQNKVAEFPLASVWDGPPVDLASTAGRDDPEVARLAAEMSQRRVPIDEVTASIAKYAASGGADAKQKLTQAFAAAFNELVRQRSDIIAGLDRFGRKQREMAERIRAENEAAHKDAGEPDEQALKKLEWDLRVFDDRRRTASYVCETPQAIETRIGEIVKAVRAAL